MEAKYGEPWALEDIYQGPGTLVSFSEENATRFIQCVNACSGIDMSNVPAGAVRELVEAALWREEVVYVSLWLAEVRLKTINRIFRAALGEVLGMTLAANGALEKALAPFKGE